MGPVHGLKIHLRIPVTIVEDENIGCVQVDTETSSPGTQHEDELGAVLRIVLLDLQLVHHHHLGVVLNKVLLICGV